MENNLTPKILLFKFIEHPQFNKMRIITPLEYGKFYHIYNRGINGEDLFRSNENYEYFLHLYEKYMEVVVDTYAWCLLGNHFHLLVHIKEEDEIGFIPSKNESSVSYEPPSGIKKPPMGKTSNRRKYNPSSQFSHLFNSNAQAFNKQHKRHGSLFESPFKRKRIDSEQYFQELICYIHNNPVHHGFTNNAMDYPWSSYQSAISSKTTKLKRTELLDWFGSTENFIKYHEEKRDYMAIEKLMIE